ncbi:MAG: diguanylate cyclase [Gallionella sp.]|nr:diguanylate cyclase [Gallionella sp.]
MSTPLRMLLVRIPDEVVNQLLNELRQGGFDPHHQCAHTLNDLERQLEGHWDALIIECSPARQGVFERRSETRTGQHQKIEYSPVCPSMLDQIANLLHARGLDIPLLAYLDNSEHDHVVAAMRAGVRDIICLHSLARLVPIMRRELKLLGRRNRRRELMAAERFSQELDRLILRDMDRAPLMAEICRQIAELFEFKLVWAGIKETDGTVSMVAASGETAYLEGLNVRWDDTPEGRGPVGRAISQDHPCTFAVDAPGFARWRERAEHYGMYDVLALPLGVMDKVSGVLALYSANREAFDEVVIQKLTGMAHHITVAMRMAERRQELRMLSLAVKHAANAMIITTRDGKIIWHNDALSQFSGYGSGEIIGQTPHLFSSGQHDKAFWRDMWQTILSGKEWRGEVVEQRKDGSRYTIIQNISHILDERGEVANFLAIQQDISQQKALEREIQHLAQHDALTGLPNRVLFLDRVQQAIVQAQRAATQFALVFLDLDGFKNVNDTHGHAAGDRLLCAVAERLKSCVRGGDTVARLGGDEFTILLLNIGGIADVETVVNKGLLCLAEPYNLGGYSVTVTASIGISLYPEHAAEMGKLLSCADGAMYRAKQSGKNNFQFYKG